MTRIKDPQAILDYNIDWNDWLINGDTISSSSWTLSTGITLQSSSVTDGVTTAWISGGTLGTTYYATNRIDTTQGRREERTITLIIEDK